ncbi:MAG: HPF/RaiA family ribosome-associated protein [Deltaproteobacteria bacterium]
MKIQLNTDKNIDGTEGLARIIEAKVEEGLRRFSDQITRIEVHLSDESGPKTGGDDKRCLLEARITGRQPMAVTHHAPSVDLAVDGAIEKLEHAITTALGKLER